MGAAWDDIETSLKDLIGQGRFSGVARVVRGDDVLLEVCGGLADRANGIPNHAGTRFGLASMCKMFTAVATLDCVRRGELTLDARVVDVLPVERRPHTLDPGVTVHHLLTHTSGIGDYFEEDEELPGYAEDFAGLWCDLPNYRIEGPDDFLPLYTDVAPNNAPGAAHHYCNAGYVLLGAVVEQAADHEFNDLVTRRVLEPLGMTSTGYPRLDEPHQDLAVGYVAATDTAPVRSNIYSIPVVGGPDGGAFSTAADIDTFLRAVWSGEFLGRELRHRMHADHWYVGDDDYGDPVRQVYGIFHRPSGAFGHGGGDPGVETMCRMWPDQDLTAVVLCNGEDMKTLAWQAIEGALRA